MNSSKQMAEAIICQIDKSRQAQLPYLVALDGRCASGKTTTAASIAEKYQKEGLPCDIVHMDDFFLQPNQRTSARLAEPGGNVDYERVEAEVLQPAKRGIDPEMQMQRILLRNGSERAEMFRNRWIPLEENYIAQCQVEEVCDLHLCAD